MTVGNNSCGGISIQGNFFANLNRKGNLYSILWTKSGVTGAVSHGNHSNTNLHYFQDYVKADIKDSAKYRVTNFEVHKPEKKDEVIVP